jgi:hypothetical protein
MIGTAILEPATDQAAPPDAPPQTPHPGPHCAITDPTTGLRVYLHPATGERFVSVTTALGVREKPRLPEWYGLRSSITTRDNLLPLIRSIHVDPCGDHRCGACLPCLLHLIKTAGRDEANTAADRGTRFHHVAEHIAASGIVIPHNDDIQGHVYQFARFLDIYQVELLCAEVTVINRTHGYAGTLDTVLSCARMPPKHAGDTNVPLYGDYKTGKNIYEEAALQVSALRHAEAILLPDGTEEPMPEGNKETGLVIQVHADNFWIRPVDIGKKTFNQFLRTLDVWRDVHESPSMIGRAMCKPRPPREA